MTGNSYSLPDSPADPGLDLFVEKHGDKKIVVVQGLGFVGAVMSLVCANALTEEYAVIGVDLPAPHSFWKIRAINEGVFPINAEDPLIEEYFKKALAKGNLYASYDPRAYAFADVIIVDINLDVDKNYDREGQLSDFSVEMDGFKNGIGMIGMHAGENVLILVETTVPPGTCENVVIPILEKAFNDRGLGKDAFYLGHSYERVMPGPEYINSIRNFYRVYSGKDKESADRTEAFLKTIIHTDGYPLTRLGNTNASEMAKVLENSYRAMNIAFVVEWSRFAEEAGVNLYEVVEAIRQRPTHRNIMLPGIGVGGYCLTKDALLASWARQMFFEGENLGQSEISISINDMMPVYAFEFLQTHAGPLDEKKILLMGVSYRQDVADTRSTPVYQFYKKIKEQGARILLHDPWVRHWEETGKDVSADWKELLDSDPEIIVFSTAHSSYRDPELMKILMEKKGLYIFDMVGILQEEEIHRLSGRHHIKVLGRGDI